MNQVFRVIWSDVRGTYIVCDENRLTRGKSKSLKCVLLIVAVAAMMGNVSAVMAENPSLPEGSVVINQGDTQTYTGESGNPLAGKTMLVAPEKNANGNYKGVRGGNLAMKNVAFGGQNVNSSSGGTAGLQTYNVDSTLENVRFINNSSAAQQGWNMGGALAVHKTAELGADSQAKATVANGVFDGNRISVAGTTVNNNPAGSLAPEAVNAAIGAAVMVKGSEITFVDTAFNNNVAESTTGGYGGFAAGGAVYVDSQMSGSSNPNNTQGLVTFRVNRDMTYSGNNVVTATPDASFETYGYETKSGGGFLFLDRNAQATFDIADGKTLTIGEAGATGNMDSIASSHMIPTDNDNDLVKTGTGTVVVNGDMSRYYGALTVDAGKFQINSDLSGAAFDTTTVNGGELALKGSYFSKEMTAQVQIANGAMMSVSGLSPAGQTSSHGTINVVSDGNDKVGGTLEMSGSTISGLVNSNDQVSGNGSGGAVRAKNVSVRISDSTFSANKTAGKTASNFGTNGGAVFIENTVNGVQASEIVRTAFIGNDVSERVNGNEWGGGAAFSTSGVTVDVADSNFSSNKADRGGAVFVQLRNNDQKADNVQRSQVNIVSSSFTNNEARAAGAIINLEGLSVSDSVFTGNKAEGDSDGGGALFLGAESQTVISSSTFIGNESNTSGGGAIDTRKGDVANNSGAGLSIADSTFTGNKAVENGGAIRNSFYTSLENANAVTIVQTTFTDNTAGRKGGAIYNDSQIDKVNNYASMAIADSTFTGNHADEAGGAIYNSANTSLALSGNNNFSGNTAGTGDNLKNNDIFNLGTLNIVNGTTTLEGGISGDGGTVNILGGILNTVMSKGAGTVNVSGGTLETATIEQGSTIALSDKGILKTASGQVMTTGLDETGTNKDAGSSRGDVSVSYNGGTLALTDAKYNLDYVKSVSDSIQSKSQIEMTGTMVNVNGEKQTEIAISGVPSGVVLNEVTGKTDQNLVIGTGSSPDSLEVNGSLGLGSIDMGNAQSVTVNDGKSLTLAGNDGELIQSKDPGGQQQAVTVELQGNGTSLNLGSAVTEKDGQLSGTINAGADTVVNIAGGNQLVTGESGKAGITTSGELNIASGATLNASLEIKDSGVASIGQNAALLADTVNLLGNSTMAVNGIANVAELTAGSNVQITVGNNQSQGSIVIGNANLNGATMFLDPAWKDGVGIDGASSAVVNFNNNEVNGKLVAGQNSLLVLGDTSADWSRDEFANSGKDWSASGITAALAVRAPMTLDSANGAIVVDGSLTGAPGSIDANTVSFAANSLLIVDAAKLDAQAAIISAGSGIATVADSAALHLANVKAGSETKILEGFDNGATSIDANGWTGNNLTSSDVMIGKLELENAGGTVSVKATANRAQDVLPGVMMGNAMDKIWAADGQGVNGDGKGINNTGSANAGIAFLSRAADERYIARGDAVRQINGAAQIAIAAGVQGTTIQASDSINNTLWDHLSLNSTVSQKGAPSLHREGADLWASMLYRDTDSSGIRTGGFNANYENDFGGIMVGSDYSWQVADKGRLRAGVALSIGKGDGHSRGDFNHTKNDYNTYGLNIYGGWNNENTNVVVDVGYLKGDNELKQSAPEALGGTLRADVDTKVWTAGLKGEYRFRTQSLDITPHVGVRYLNVKTDGFDTRNNSGTVFRTSGDTQNLWQIPLGVTLSKDYVAENGWTIKPKFDISIIPTAGDKNASTRVSVPGVSSSDVASAEVMDGVSWNGALGLEVQKGNTSFGLKVGYQKSDDAKSKSAMLNISHQFD